MPISSLEGDARTLPSPGMDLVIKTMDIADQRWPGNSNTAFERNIAVDQDSRGAAICHQSSSRLLITG
jgi:hypothetical protein